MKETNKKAFKVSSFSNRRFGNPVRNGSPCLRHEDDVRRKFAFTLAEGATHVGTSNTKRKFAFTLAEVLITLGIIGVVAALTIPTLMSNYKERAYATASEVFQTKFQESLKTMNVDGGLGKYGKYDTTEGFVEELKKHFKIANVCDNEHLMQCFESSATWGDGEADLKKIKEAKDMVQYGPDEEDWGTNVLGVQFGNGVSGLIAYNPKCKSDPHNNQITGSDCYALVYDTSGFSEPNELGKDLRATANVKNLSSTAMDINGVKVTKIITPDLIAPVNCTDTSSPDYQYCPTEDVTQHETDYWAGAVKACGGRDNLSSETQLKKIAEGFYKTGSFDNELANSLGLDTSKSTISIIGQELHSVSWFTDELVHSSITLFLNPGAGPPSGYNMSTASAPRDGNYGNHVFCVEN